MRVTAGACLEGAHKKQDHNHENIEHGRVSGCVDLCLNVLVSARLVRNDNLERKNKSRSGKGFAEYFNHGAKGSKAVI